MCNFPISPAKAFYELHLRKVCHVMILNKLSPWKKKKNRKAGKYLEKGPSTEESFMWKVSVNFDVLKFILLDTLVI